MHIAKTKGKTDNSRLDRGIRLAYLNMPSASPYTLDEVRTILLHFFRKYEHVCGKAHPEISVPQLERVIECMPYADEQELSPDAYRAMIDQFFMTPLEGDYNINLFLSGKVRWYRYYEACY